MSILDNGIYSDISPMDIDWQSFESTAKNQLTDSNYMTDPNNMNYTPLVQ